MLELIEAGGWLMWPILLCSILSCAIIGERLWSLQKKRIMPDDLVASIWHWQKLGTLDDRLEYIERSSPLGRILAAGLLNREYEREIMKENVEEAGRHIAHDMERFLNTLGTIASISPLLGLLGTVIGMIKVFAVITVHGVGDAGILAEGISEALITTATGLSVAIPSLMFHRYFRRRIDELVIGMEQEALRMIEIMSRESRAVVSARTTQ